MPALIVIALRLVLPLTILRWPLAGGLLALVIDAIYAQLDKWLDLYYLTLELVVARRWSEMVPRRTAYVLFAWRLIGVILFEITLYRPLLVVFPNLFENYFLYILVARRWFPRFVPRTVRQSVLASFILLIPKELQEYVLHYAQLHPWQWLRETFIKPLIGG